MISLLVPSRGRPEQLAAMWVTALETAHRPDDLELVARVDDDDPARDAYVEPFLGMVTLAAIYSGPRMLLSECWNECHRHAHGDLFMHAADDIRFRTPGWDTAVHAAFDRWPDRIAFVHGRDGIHDQALGTHGFLSAEWVAAVGYFVPPLFSSDYNDTWLNEVADTIGRRVYLPEVYTEHLHPLVGKGAIDATHEERMARAAADDVAAIWEQTGWQRQRDADRLRTAMGAAA